MKILVTGGAGYIGSCVVKYLVDQKHDVYVLDDLSTGHREAVDKSVPLLTADYGDRADWIIHDIKPEAVIHLAAVASVPDSFNKVEEYYENNVVKMKQLLDACGKYGVKYFIFSSSAAVYGNYSQHPYKETDGTYPINPYGNTKLIDELMLKDYAQKYGMKYVIFRYFCAAGSDIDHFVGEQHEPETHVIPVMIRCWLQNKTFKIFGDNYPTVDGTCIRDFVHIKDIASAHLLALDYLQDENNSSEIFNLGGAITSIKSLVNTFNHSILISSELPYEIAESRHGDPGYLVADIYKALNILHWEPVNSIIAVILRDAFWWEKRKQ